MVVSMFSQAQWLAAMHTNADALQILLASPAGGRVSGQCAFFAATIRSGLTRMAEQRCKRLAGLLPNAYLALQPKLLIWLLPLRCTALRRVQALTPIRNC
jgi:hypothetical protein